LDYDTGYGSGSWDESACGLGGWCLRTIRLLFGQSPCSPMRSLRSVILIAFMTSCETQLACSLAAAVLGGPATQVATSPIEVINFDNYNLTYEKSGPFQKTA
jgi:hypothetical protein